MKVCEETRQMGVGTCVSVPTPTGDVDLVGAPEGGAGRVVAVAGVVVAQVAVDAVAGHLPAVHAVGAEGRVGGRDRGEPDGAEDVGDRVARAGVDQVRVERHEADDGDLHGRGLRGLVHVGDRLVRHDRQVDRVVFDDEGHGDVLPGDLDLAVGGDVDVDGQGRGAPARSPRSAGRGSS